jgi:hypothetical protein
VPTANRWTAAFDAQNGLKALIDSLGVVNVPVFLGYPSTDALPREWICVAGKVPAAPKQQVESGIPGRGQDEQFTLAVLISVSMSTADYAPIAARADEIARTIRAALVTAPNYTLGGNVNWCAITDHDAQETYGEQSQRGLDLSLEVTCQANIT